MGKRGRPKLENSISTTDRVHKFQKSATNREKENEARKEKRKKSSDLSEEALAEKRRSDNIRKQQSRLKASRQKKRGELIKNKNHVQKIRVAESEQQEPETSTTCVQKHRRLTVDFKFKRRSKDASKKIAATLDTFSPKSKRCVILGSCNESLSPNSQADVGSSLGSDGVAGVLTGVSRRRDNNSNCVRRVILNDIVESCGSVSKAKSKH